MGRNAYGRHQGVSGSAVSKAIRSGRISRAVEYDSDGTPRIDWRLADELWRQNTDPRQACKTRGYDYDPCPPGATPEYRLSILVGQLLEDAAISIGAHALNKHQIAPTVSTDIICFTLLCLNMALDKNPHAPIWLPPSLEPQHEAELVEAIEKYASETREPVKRTRRGKNVS